MTSSSDLIRPPHAAQNDRPFPSSTQKGRQFFQKVQPTFSVSPGITQLEFVDNSDPQKDVVVRKKAREWVFRNREVTRGNKAPIKKDHLQRGKPQNKKDIGTKISLCDPGAGRVDPFDALPNVGRKVDHIIEFYHSTSKLRLHFLTSSIVLTQCPEEVPGSEDKEAGRSNSLMARTSRENTVLGTMAYERISFVLWLHATTLLKDGMNGISGSSDSMYFYILSLQTMQEELNRSVTEFSDAFLVALACFSACANFTGDYKASRMHRDAMIKAVTLRGGGDLKKGLDSCKPWTQKALVWCEVHAAAQTPSLPLLPYTPPPSKETISDEIILTATHLTAATFAHVPPLAAPFTPLLLQLHQLCLLQPPPDRDNKLWPGYHKADPAGIRPLYRTEYMILQVLTSQEQKGHPFTPFEVMFSNAFQLFLWPAVRGLPPEMKMCDLFVERLQKALIPLLSDIQSLLEPSNTTNKDASFVDTSNSNFIHAPTTITLLNPSSPAAPLVPIHSLDYPIIWALFLGTIMTSVGGRPQNTWYKERLRWMITVRNAHVFHGPQDLKRVLKLFPYTESFCGMGISRIGFEL